jgi:hypothetical protein
MFKIDYKVKTIKDNYYDKSLQALEKYRKNEFGDKIKAKEFDIENIGIDNFYVASYNFTLSYLQNNNKDINNNFYNNICEPLFKEEKQLLKAIKLFYEPTKYNEIKQKFNINSKNIKIILFGYRFCLNEIESKNIKGIYYPLYDSNNIKYLESKLYPGNDTKPNELYSNIINHFKNKPNEGCYVCLCKKSYYHSVPCGFPDSEEIDMLCPNCLEPIGSCKKGLFFKEISIVKRDNYYRILKDEKEIEDIEKNKTKRVKLKSINFMTLSQFKEKYIDKSFINEKGIYKADKNGFKNDEKIIRNLSQISYRLLNFILYSHLFFARLITDKNDFDKYLPKGMSWVDTLYECWNILKNELLKENIDSIEKFMNYMFVYLFPILNKGKSINNFEDLIELENNLESIIQKIIKDYKKENKNKENNYSKSDEKDSFINLIKEKYTSDYYIKKDFPFYEYFYYTNYLDEEFINEKLKHMDDNKYPVLRKYLENMNKAKDIRFMFAYCKSLLTIDSLYKWKLNENVKKDYIIQGCDEILNIPSIFKNTSSSCVIY